MDVVVNKLNDKSKMIMLFVLIVLVLGFSWQGSIDDVARSYLNQSIKDAAVIYGATRLINAVVSVLQSIDVSIVFASIQLGDFLTPIQDTLERFAEVMTFAIVSLTLQRVLIEIVEHSFFNVLLTLSGIGLCLAVFTKMYVTQAARVFITLFFIRFSLALVLMLNMACDHAFLEQKVQHEHEKMNEMKQQLDSAYQTVTGEGEQKNNPDQQVKPVKADEVVNMQTSIPEPITVVKDQYTEKAAADDSVWSRFTSTVSTTVDAATDVVLHPVDTASNMANATTEAVDSAVESAKSFINTKDIVLDKLKELKEHAMLWVESFLTMMALFLLKTILLPLLFWYVLLRGMKLIWIKEWSYPYVETKETIANQT